MTTFIEIKVGEEPVGVIHIPNEAVNHPWLTIADSETTVVEIVDSGVLPAVGDRWDGSKFLDLSGETPNPDFAHFAFIVDGKCVLVQPVSIEHSIGIIAAYRSGATFEARRGTEV